MVFWICIAIACIIISFFSGAAGFSFGWALLYCAGFIVLALLGKEAVFQVRVRPDQYGEKLHTPRV